MSLLISDDCVLNMSLALFLVVSNSGFNVLFTSVGSYLFSITGISKYDITEFALVAFYYSLLEIPISLCLFAIGEAIDIHEKLEKVLGSRLLSPIYYFLTFSGVKFVLSPCVGSYSLNNIDALKNITNRILGKDLEIRLTDYTALSSCGWAATVSVVTAATTLVVIFSPKTRKLTKC
ncbi:MAG: hypothetical protein VX335_01265 [Pseudomonadota bacterium]|nr:hypothetical protein [Pseudomonadota bacterium]